MWKENSNAPIGQKLVIQFTCTELDLRVMKLICIVDWYFDLTWVPVSVDAYQLTIDRIHVQLCIRSIVSFQGGKHPKISGYVSTGHIPIPLVHVYIAFNCNPSHRAKCKHANPSHRAKSSPVFLRQGITSFAYFSPNTLSTRAQHT
jgi:hypothetical protein